MTPEQVDLVQRTWRVVLPVGDTAAELFYGKLFNLDPSIEVLFRHDMREQGRNLTAMISVAVGSLSRPERITLAVQQLGKRHAAYGVQPRHYEPVGIALLWMLEQVLGDAFTPEVRGAWKAVYDLLATTMQGACAYSQPRIYQVHEGGRRTAGVRHRRKNAAKSATSAWHGRCEGLMRLFGE